MLPALLKFEDAARYRDQIRTVEELRERQKMAANSGEEADILGFHQEGPLVAVNLFHLRGGRVLDRREFFWEDLEEFNPREFFSSLLKQLYLDQQYLAGGNSCARGLRRSRTAGGNALAEARAARPYSHSASRAQARAAGTGGAQRPPLV